MPYPGAFTLPLENEYDELISYEETTVLVASDSESQQKSEERPKSVQGQRKRQTPAKKQPRSSACSKILFTWRMLRWHILIFLVLFSSLYSILHYGFDNSQQKVILLALAFCDDWKQLVFFFGIYLSFAVKKVSDVTNVSTNDLS